MKRTTDRVHFNASFHNRLRLGEVQSQSVTSGVVSVLVEKKFNRILMEEEGKTDKFVVHLWTSSGRSL